MRYLLLLMLLKSVNTLANFPPTQCRFEKKHYLAEWRIEISGVRAAFFDNDIWAKAQRVDPFNVFPAVSLFHSINPKDPFIIKLQILPFIQEITWGRLEVILNSKQQSLVLDCYRVKEEDLSYLY